MDCFSLGGSLQGHFFNLYSSIEGGLIKVLESKRMICLRKRTFLILFQSYAF